MRYYTKKTSSLSIKKMKINKGFIVIITIILLFNTGLYFISKRILPALLLVSEERIKSDVTDIINDTSIDLYSKNFKYDEFINIEKDNNGKISMIRADTVKMNKLSSELITTCNKKLRNYGSIGVEVPIGYLTGNAMFHSLGPTINIKMENVGHMEANYDSVFESAGINQTRHKIYLNVKSKVKVILPFNDKEIEIVTAIPVAETIIVGEIPDAAINLKDN